MLLIVIVMSTVSPSFINGKTGMPSNFMFVVSNLLKSQARYEPFLTGHFKISGFIILLISVKNMLTIILTPFGFAKVQKLKDCLKNSLEFIVAATSTWKFVGNFWQKTIDLLNFWLRFKLTVGCPRFWKISAIKYPSSVPFGPTCVNFTNFSLAFIVQFPPWT